MHALRKSEKIQSLMAFLRKWMLAVSMLVGAGAYFAYSGIEALQPTHAFVGKLIGIVQPSLIFIMLLLTFLRIRISELRLRKWHMWALLYQLGLFFLCVPLFFLLKGWGIIVEGAMLCLICPTATACAVVTSKLGGDQAAVATYTILINLAVAIFVPIVFPFIHPSMHGGFIHDAWLILTKVFPLLIMPLLAATFMRRYMQKTTERLLQVKDLAFYLWTIGLALAIGMTVRSLVHSSHPIEGEIGIAVASLLACTVQFAGGRWMGNKMGDRVTIAQSLGQKNTILAIWMGYTFLSPVTSIAGGFYSVWHNIYNSYQLAKKEKGSKE